MIADLWRDLRFALRGLRLRPGYSVLVIVTLALGIGANVAIFDLTNAAVLRPIDVPEPDELVLLGPGGARGRKTGGNTSIPARDGRLDMYPYSLFQSLAEQLEGVTIAARDPSFKPSIVWPESAAAADGGIANGRCASASFFDVLGVRASIGRTFEPEDDRVQGARPVVVLSHRYWQLRFDSNPKVVGERLMISGKSYQVIGVGPPGFTGATPGNRIDFWVPLGMANTFSNYGPDLHDESFSWLSIIGRLKPGVSPESVEADANLVLQRYIAAEPKRTADMAQEKPRIEVEPGATGFSRTRETLMQPLIALMMGVGLLLLIVYLNVSHLMLARATNRQHEMSIRTSLGATRGRLVRQLLTEGLLLAGLGAAVGGLVAGWLSRGLADLASGSAGSLNYQLELGADERVVGFTLALTFGTAFVLGLVPAGHAMASTSQRSMRSASRTVAGGRRRGSSALMAAQVGLSLVLLISAGLLATSLSRLSEVPSGFDEEHVLLAELELAQLGLDERRMQFLAEDIPRRLKAQPGVAAASLSSTRLFAGGRGAEVAFPGTDLPPKGFPFYRVTPGYFETMGQQLLGGRGFSDTDHAAASRVALVNETMAKKEFGGRGALGQRIRLDGQTNEVEVVGVVSDTRTFTLREAPFPLFYLPMSQPHGLATPLPPRSLEVRAHADPVQLTEMVRRTLAEAQPGLVIRDVNSVRQQVEGALVIERLVALLASVFGFSALLLVGVGLYGVISQWVAQRNREIGVRIALGATPGTVQRLVLRQALVPVLIGLVLGTLAMLPLSDVLGAILFGVEPLDIPTMAGAVFALLAVAVLAAYVPARRASRVQPVVAMRAE